MANIYKVVLFLFTFILFSSLIYGYSATRFHDIPIYKCYALSFLNDNKHIDILVKNSCSLNSLTDQPYHAMPSEYPILALIPFTLPVILPINLYEKTYIFEMFAVVIFLFFYLKRVASFKSAWLFVNYLALGSFGTALTRFDLFPAAFLLFCLHAAISRKYILAYLFLAIATLLKLFPILLLIPLFLNEQSHFSGSYYKLQRYKGIIIFILTCAAITALSFAINPQAAISPVKYFQARPFEIESVPATILWLFSLFGMTKTCIGLQFNSWNLFASAGSDCNIAMNTPAPLLTNSISLGFLLFFMVGIVWLYFNCLKKKISLEKMFILILLLELLTTKIFSPQYIIWITPLMAYVYAKKIKWIFLWSSICAVTTIIYPYLFGDTYMFPNMNTTFLLPSIFIRNCLLFIMFIWLWVENLRPERLEQIHEITD